MEINQLLLSKYLLTKGQGFIKKDDEISCGIAISLLQDSSEMLLRAIAKHVDADVGENDKFMQFWDKIKKAPKNAGNKDVPKRAQMTEVNKARVNFKHYGHTPNPNLVSQLADYTEAFIKECIATFFDLNFDDISMADLIKTDAIRTKIKAAEQSFKESQYRESVTSCAIAEVMVSHKLEDVLPSSQAKSKGRLHRSGGRLTGELNSLIEAIATDLSNQKSLIIAALLNIDLSDMMKFNKIVPHVSLSYGGKEFVSHVRQASFDEREASFCLNYVTDYALIVERLISDIDRDSLWYYYQK